MLSTRSRGVTFWGFTLILSSLYQIIVLASAGYDNYSFLHQEYSQALILARYIFSWIIKIAGLAAGIGVLKLNNFFRKLAIFNSLLIICTVNLKHTYAAYRLHTMKLDQTFGPLLAKMGYGITFSSLTWPALIIQRSIDIVFGLALIYFFTRPTVKVQFK